MRADAPMRVVVCGTVFGQVYLQAFAEPGPDLELVAVLSRGSARSRSCADAFGVPLCTRIEDLPPFDCAAVVVRGGLLGGPGVELARALMERGANVLMEHPLHEGELAECLRTASRCGVHFQLNPFYVHLPSVRRLVAATRWLSERESPRYIDASCGFQVGYALLAILAKALAVTRPWRWEVLDLPGGASGPFRVAQGQFGGVPMVLRIQNELDPADPDNGAHLLHEVQIGFSSGTLVLPDTHGPLLWRARPAFPAEVRAEASGSFFEGERIAGVPCVASLGPLTGPDYSTIFARTWPGGVRTALCSFRERVLADRSPLDQGQIDLTLCAIWQDLTARLGPPEPVRAHRAPGLDLEALAELRALVDPIGASTAGRDQSR